MKTWRNLGGLALLGALALPVAAVAVALPSPDVPTPAPPQEFAAGDPAFYDVPDPLPAAEHGDLVRWQVVDSSFTLRYRIMYVSETIAGAPTLVTAIVDAPDGVAPFGGHRMLLFGHSATGFDDTCAPSTVVDEAAADRDLVDEFESMSSAGWVLVSTDYEGLGGPGLHPMLVGVSEGRSMLDAGRAARQLPTLYVGATTAVAGLEQGGHAAVWAAEQAPQWTPELSIVATVVAAPASEVGSLASSAAAQPQTEALPLAIAAGLATTYPQALLALGQVLTPAGSAMLEQWNSLCFDAEADIPGPYLSTDLATVEPFATLMGQNTAGTVATSAPLLIIHGDGDERVPVEQSDALLTRLCAAGQMVERRVVTGRNHSSIISELQGAGVDWVTGVADGTLTPTSSCA